MCVCRVVCDGVALCVAATLSAHVVAPRGLAGGVFSVFWGDPVFVVWCLPRHGVCFEMAGCLADVLARSDPGGKEGGARSPIGRFGVSVLRVVCVCGWAVGGQSMGVTVMVMVMVRL